MNNKGFVFFFWHSSRVSITPTTSVPELLFHCFVTVQQKKKIINICMKIRRVTGGKRKRVYAEEKMTVSIPKQIRGGMPTKLKTKLIYGQRHAVTGAILPEYVFSGNGLYDPDNTGAGHQPRGFDQLMALYDHFYVTASKITVWFHSLETVSGDEMMVFVLPSDANTVAAANTDVLEHDNVKLALIGLENTGALRAKLEHQCTTKSQISTLDYSIIRGTASANPTESWYWHIGAIGNGSSTLNMVAYVRIEYDSVFSEPKMPGQS